MVLRRVLGMIGYIAIAVALPHWAAADRGFGFPAMGSGGIHLTHDGCVATQPRPGD